MKPGLNQVLVVPGHMSAGITTIVTDRRGDLMRKLLIALILVLVATFSIATAETGYHRTSVSAVKWLLEQDIDYAIVDARDSGLYKASHVPGAINIPLSELKSKTTAKLPDKDQIIVVYCSASFASREAAQILADSGYTYVYYFGFLSWTGEIEGVGEYDDDPSEVEGYADPEDFYYDYYDEFDDYEEAEEYYYEHGGW